LVEKVRVFQLAKDLGVSSREVLWALKQMNVPAKNHMSTLEVSLIDGVKEQLRIPVDKPKPPEGPAEAPQPSDAARPGPREAQPAPEPKAKGPVAKAEPQEKKDRPRPAAAKPSRPPAVAPKQAQPQPQGRDARAGSDATDKAPRSRGPRGRRRSDDGRSRRRGRGRGRARRITDLGQVGAERSQELVIEGPITVGNLANKMGVRPSDAIRKLIEMGVMAGVNQEIEPFVASQLAPEFGFEVREDGGEAAEAELMPQDQAADPERLEDRWPVVTVMGHVDHGKTSLLDAIRETDVTAEEAGGITQHIGASVVEAGGRRIVFLDTPGHEAFTAMRARGAQATDIAVLVVAADDGVMPQTVEAINHCRAARVPILVCINKMDKADANPDRVKQQLAEYNLVPEEWGGETIFVEVSAKTRQKMDSLLEMVNLLAEMMELQADPQGPAKGTIIEAELDRGRGPVATVVVHQGTLRVGDAFVAGTTEGRVRAMFDDRGQKKDEAGPSTPVEVLGFSDVPAAGDVLTVVTDERIAREIATRRADRRKRQELETSGQRRLSRLLEQIQGSQVKELNLVLKADVQGSVEAVNQALEKIESKDVRVQVIHSAVGGITESDVMLASASDAMIIGFNVRPDINAQRSAEAEEVEIRTYRVIYDVIEDIKRAISGMVEPVKREVVLGRAEVRATFKVPKAGTVAGCYVQDGKIARNGSIRVIRDGKIIHEGEVSSLKRFKDDVREVESGYECGLGVRDFDDVKEGDVLEVFRIEEVRPET